MIFVVIFR